MLSHGFICRTKIKKEVLIGLEVVEKGGEGIEADF
jgi:hypothetical protein